ncbi:MAG: Mu transposase domain-containing protein [Dermatophilaceae bacterium]
MPDQPFPAVSAVTRRVSAQALVAYAGNFYSVAPEHTGATVAVLVRLGSTYMDITTATSPPLVLARHRLQPGGAGVMVRDEVHVTALNTLAMRSASSPRPHRRKERIPPGPAARAAAARLGGGDDTHPETSTPIVDLTQYAKAAHGRNTLT